MALNLTIPQPLEASLASIDRRTPIGTALGTAGIERIPARIRRRTFFSARVEKARWLQEAHRRIRKAANLEFGSDRATFIADMQELGIELGMKPDDGTRGTLQDPTSARRLGLIFDIQTGLAAGEARWMADQTPISLRMFPCYELVRSAEREVPRDWPARWEAAGGRFFEGRMIATKVDPIWVKISRFECPWPPFDFNSGMGLRDVRRREALRLGAISDKTLLEPVLDQIQTPVEADIQGLDQPFADALLESFGDTVSRSADGKRIALDESAVSDFVTDALEGRNRKAVLDLGTSEPRTRDVAREAGLVLAERFRFQLRREDALRALDAQLTAEVQEWDELPDTLWRPDLVERFRSEPSAGDFWDFVSFHGPVENRARVSFRQESGEVVGQILGFFKRLLG